MNDIMFNMFKDYFKLGLFTIDDCRKAVQCGYFGEEQFKEITGEDYVASTPENTSATSTTPSSTKFESVAKES